jgi:hypothetical protein
MKGTHPCRWLNDHPDDMVPDLHCRSPLTIPRESETTMIPMRGACRNVAAHVKSHFGGEPRLSPTCYKKIGFRAANWRARNNPGMVAGADA